MKLKDEILINKFGQGLIAIEQLTDRFGLLEVLKKKEFQVSSKPRKKEKKEPEIKYYTYKQ